jgi:hypothetical protein
MTFGQKIIFIFAIGLFSCSNPKTQIKLMPGHGVIVDKDTLSLDEYSPKDLTTFIRMKDTFDLDGVHWDGYDSLGNEVNGTYFKKDIPFDGMMFTFIGLNEDSLLLKSIYIDLKHSSRQIFLTEKVISDTSVSVIKKYPNSLRKDISVENSSEHGITFILDTSTTPIKIEKISIHSK